MAKWSYSQLVSFAHGAGFNTPQAIIAAAIAMAESGGDDHAYNPETGAGTPKGHGSRGLWQIYGWAHPEYDNDSMYDPAKNAAAAHAIFLSQGWNAWSTYKSGAYTKYLNDAGSGTPPPPPDNQNKNASQPFNPPGGLTADCVACLNYCNGDPVCMALECGSFPWQACWGQIATSQPTSQTVAGVAQGAGAAFFGPAWDWISNPIRVIKLVVGTGLVLISLLGTFFSSGAGRTVVQIAGAALA